MEKIKTNDYELYIGDKHSYVVDQLKQFGYYEMDIDTLKYYINKGDTVIDIGANIGYYTIMFSKLVGPDGTVYCFEPGKTNFEILMKNIELNNCQNIVHFNMALGDISGRAKLFRSDECMGMHRMYKSKYTTDQFTEIDIRRMDDIIETAKPTFIKIDVEGYESKVLRGMSRLLERTPKCTMWLEMTEEGEKEAGDDIEETKRFLEKHGFILSSADFRNYWCLKS